MPWKPKAYMPLYAQEHHEQILLFTPEPRTEPKCDHPELTEPQRDFFGAETRLCVQCGSRVATD